MIRNRKCSVSLLFSDDQAVSATWVASLTCFYSCCTSWGSSFTYQTWTCSLNLQHHQRPSSDSPSHQLVYSDFSFLQQQLRPFTCHVQGYITCCLLARWQFTVEDNSLKIRTLEITKVFQAQNKLQTRARLRLQLRISTATQADGGASRSSPGFFPGSLCSAATFISSVQINQKEPSRQ